MARSRLPLLPLLYFGLAHLALSAAFLVVAHEPEGVTGFFYHPRMVFVVHLVTLGWITSSILGALYLVGPMALRTAMPAAAADYGSFALYALGGSGVAFHFWIDELSGVGLSGILVTLAIGRIAVKFLLALASSRVDSAVKTHFALAFANFGLAALAGIAQAFDKLAPFLAGYVLDHVSAHAHLAALGWATMMVFAAGYRLLPMLLPSAMPEGRGVWAGAVLFEIGILGLAAALFFASPWRKVFAAVTVAGIAAFFVQVSWMKRHPRRAARALKRPDWGVAQALVALGYLAASAVLGLVLAFAPSTEETLRLTLVYGTFGLVGFLAQIVAGVSTRLMPIFTWLRASANAPPSWTPHDLPDRRLQSLAFFLWIAGVPALAAGFYFDRPAVVGWAAWLLLAAVAAGGLHSAVILRRGLARDRATPPP